MRSVWEPCDEVASVQNSVRPKDLGKEDILDQWPLLLTDFEQTSWYLVLCLNLQGRAVQRGDEWARRHSTPQRSLPKSAASTSCSFGNTQQSPTNAFGQENSLAAELSCTKVSYSLVAVLHKNQQWWNILYMTLRSYIHFYQDCFFTALQATPVV